jgi:hypothetical protein
LISFFLHFSCFSSSWSTSSNSSFLVSLASVCNTTNENKHKELFNFEFPYINQEFIEHPPKKQKIFEIFKTNKKLGRIKKILNIKENMINYQKIILLEK